MLMSHSAGWNTTISSLASQNVEGKDAILTAVRELEEHGYLRREGSRSESGRFESDWVLQDPPPAVEGKPETVAPPAPPVVDAPQEVDTETGEVTEEEPTEIQYISKVDQGRISAGLEELGVMSPADKRDVVKEWSGLEELRGVNGLTVEQGAAVLDRIEREKKIMHGE